MLATIGGEDQITVVPHLDPGLVRADPKPFLGYSDNTNLLTGWDQRDRRVLRRVDPGAPRARAAVDDIHARSLCAALLTGETLEITEPGESEDIGMDWGDPAP